MKNGIEQLRDWMKRRGFNQSELANHFGWHESVISQYLGGQRTPNLDNALLIEDKTGIPVRAWASSELDDSEMPATGTHGKRRFHKA